MNAAPKPDPLAAVYKQGWTAARNQWKPRAKKAEAELAETRKRRVAWEQASNSWQNLYYRTRDRVDKAETDLANLRQQLATLAKQLSTNTDPEPGGYREA